MTDSTTRQAPPPKDLLDAMERLRRADFGGALERAEAGAPGALDPAPFHALASLAALRHGVPDRAIPHLQKLLALKPEDQASRANLANALIETGRAEEALPLVAGSDAANFARIEGFIHQQAGRLEEAAAAYRRAIAADRNDLSALNNLGNILAQTGDIDGAIEAFEMAITLAPLELEIYFNLSELLLNADLNQARLKVLTDARQIAPDDLRVLVDLGLTQAKLDDIDAAIATFRHAIELSPEFSDAHVELGMVLESLNRTEELAALVASVDPETAPPEFAFLLAWQARRDGRFEDAARHASDIPETVHPIRRHHLVAGIADRLGDADAAYAAFERMNRAALDTAPDRSGRSYREHVERQTEQWTREWANAWQEAEIEDGQKDPVFLVGFPRSGTTLLDTMLMGLPELSVLEERPMMAGLVRMTANEPLPAMQSGRIAELRSAYFEEARQSGWDGSRWLVDKHPLNMQRVPLIKRLFPQAKIILAERHPYDVVLSCFMANFTLNYAMRSFTSLDEGARTYDAVWQAWSRGVELLAPDWRPVRYERLVVDPRGELEPLIEWLGLDWNPRLLDHTGSARERGRVRTASYSQIGEELYTHASNRWRRYAAHIAPVVPILKPWAERMQYETD